MWLSGLPALARLALGLLSLPRSLGLPLRLDLLALAALPLELAGRRLATLAALELASLTALGLAARGLAARGLTRLRGLALRLRTLTLCALTLRALALVLPAALAKPALPEPERGPVGQIRVLDRLRDRARLQVGGGQLDQFGGRLHLRGQVHLFGVLAGGDHDLPEPRRREKLPRLLVGASGQGDAGRGRADRQRHAQRQQQRFGRPADHGAHAHAQVFAVVHAAASPS